MWRPPPEAKGAKLPKTHAAIVRQGALPPAVHNCVREATTPRGPTRRRHRKTCSSHSKRLQSHYHFQVALTFRHDTASSRQTVGQELPSLLHYPCNKSALQSGKPRRRRDNRGHSGRPGSEPIAETLLVALSLISEQRPGFLSPPTGIGCLSRSQSDTGWLGSLTFARSLAENSGRPITKWRFCKRRYNNLPSPTSFPPRLRSFRVSDELFRSQRVHRSQAFQGAVVGKHCGPANPHGSLHKPRCLRADKA